MSLQRRAFFVVVVGLVAVGCTKSAASKPGEIAESAVQIVADGCRHFAVHGAGLMVAEGRIATVAHVVAGATRIEVRGIHGSTEATVVYFDPINDVAVLKVDPGLATPISVGTAAAGDRGNVIVYRADAPTELPAEVQRLVDIRTADIYGEGKYSRPGYEFNLDIQAGDSGAVVVVDGKAVALVWASSRLAEARAWTMRTSLIADHLSASTPVDNGHCV